MQRPSPHNSHSPRAKRAARARLARSRAPRVAALAIIAAIIATVTGVGTTVARADTTRTLTVTPATGLGNQVALVHWAGFDPTVGFTDQVIILECKANPHQIDADRNTATVDDCLTAPPFPNTGNEIKTGITQSDGTGSAFIEVLAEAQNTELGCNESTPCSIVAYESNGVAPPVDSLPTTAVVAPITFAPSVNDCPPVSSFDVQAEGEASAATLLYNWAAHLCTADPKLVFDYTQTSSVAGRQDFLHNLVQVGVTSMPPTAAELAAASGHRAYTYAPIAIDAVTVAYNMTDAASGKQITDLTLTPRLLAEVISNTNLTSDQFDKSGFFFDPELNSLNPGHTWPTSALSPPLLRAEQNADTYMTTDWIAHNSDAESFLQGHDPDGVVVNPSWQGIHYPTDAYVNADSKDTGYLPLQGEPNVVRKTFYAVEPEQTAAQNTAKVGFIGLVDLPTAMRYDLPTAKLMNASKHAVAPDAAGITAGYQAMTTNPDGITKYPNFATTDAAAYPLVKVDYAMIPTSVSTATQQTNLRRFLAYIAGDGQKNLPPGYMPLTSDLLAQDAAAAAKITVKAPSKPTTTTTTTPPTTGTTVPLSSLGGGFDTGNGFTSSGSSDPTTSVTTDPRGSSTTPTTAADGSPTKLASSKQVVNVADPGERFGLPILALLALLAGLYPLSRKAIPLTAKGYAAVSRMPRRFRKPPPTDLAP